MAEFLPKLTLQIPPRGNMYSLEGPDGAGKSTQAKALESALRERNYEAVHVTNPSKSVMGEFLRENLGTLPAWQRVSLFLLDMADVLNTHNDHNKILIWDRYIHSTLISNKDIEPSQIAPLLEGFPKPRFTFLLKIDPQDILDTRSESSHDHSTDLGWQHLKLSRYEDLLRANPSEFFVVDAGLPRKEITEIILERILSDLS